MNYKNQNNHDHGSDRKEDQEGWGFLLLELITLITIGLGIYIGLI
jgi:hypothetical protein